MLLLFAGPTDRWTLALLLHPSSLIMSDPLLVLRAAANALRAHGAF